MTTFKIDSSWNQIKGKLKQKYGQLTDDDLAFAEGKGEELFGRLQAKLGLSAEDLDRTLEDLKREALTSAAEGADKLQDLKNRATAAVEDVKQAAAARAGELRGQAEEVYGQARQRAQTLREDGEEYVRHNPRQALLTAVAIGFVAGLLVRR